MRRVLLEAWRHERRERPLAARLGLIALATVTAAAALAGVRLYLLAQLVGGLALVPLAVATYLRMLPASPWGDDGGNGGGPGRGPDRPRGSEPNDGPQGDVDWERFEREFRAYAERRPLAHL
ncbi:MAG: hypothetical protein JO262_05495 [Solirubrobacterales bacterium]|nr:hypothetical protein [Solirubrobacterales bacterium]MBV9941568.1 hypothetical protein [Solirubrobacterales bacterium]